MNTITLSVDIKECLATNREAPVRELDKFINRVLTVQRDQLAFFRDHPNIGADPKSEVSGWVLRNLTELVPSLKWLKEGGSYLFAGSQIHDKDKPSREE